MPSTRAALWLSSAVNVGLLGLVAYLAFGPRLNERDAQAAFRDRQAAHLARLERGAKRGAVLLIGASSIQGVDGATVSAHTLNLGLGGETVHQTAERLQAYRSVERASCVVLQTGMNDLEQGRTPESTARDLEQLLGLVPASVPLVLSGLQPLGASRAERYPTWATAIGEYNGRIRTICEAHGACQFVDLAGVLSSDQLCAGNVVHELDELHLNPRGYVCWTRALHNAVVRACR